MANVNRSVTTDATHLLNQVLQNIDRLRLGSVPLNGLEDAHGAVQQAKSQIALCIENSQKLNNHDDDDNDSTCGNSIT